MANLSSSSVFFEETIEEFVQQIPFCHQFIQTLVFSLILYWYFPVTLLLQKRFCFSSDLSTQISKNYRLLLKEIFEFFNFLSPSLLGIIISNTNFHQKAQL